MKSPYPIHNDDSRIINIEQMPENIRKEWKKGKWSKGGLRRITKEERVSRSALEKDAIYLKVDFMNYFWFLEKNNLLFLYKSKTEYAPLICFGKIYPNIMLLAKGVNVSLTELRIRILEHGDIDKAVLHTEKKFNTSEKIRINYNGVFYDSLIAACRAAKVDYYKVKTLRSRGFSPIEAIKILEECKNSA